MSQNSRPTADPAAIPVPEFARMLTRAGGPAITEAAVRDDLARGAPANVDGTIHLVHFAAWLVREALRENRHA